MGIHFDNLEGREFGYLKVLKFMFMNPAGKDGTHYMSHYLCECKVCGKRKIQARSTIMQRSHEKHCHHKKGWF